MKRITLIGFVFALFTAAGVFGSSTDRSASTRINRRSATMPARSARTRERPRPGQRSLTTITFRPRTSSRSSASSPPQMPPAPLPADERRCRAQVADDDQAKKQAAWKAWQTKLAAQKDRLTSRARELDVLQREYQLRAAAMYADAGNRMRNASAVGQAGRGLQAEDRRQAESGRGRQAETRRYAGGSPQRRRSICHDRVGAARTGRACDSVSIG